jgi:amino acid adenylation domain-containing protein
MDPTDSAITRAAAVPGNQPLDLTAAQRGMWFAENLSTDYSVIIAHYLDIQDDDRPLDIDLLSRIVRAVGWDLQSPFTRIVEIDGVPAQVVDAETGFGLDIVDLRDRDDPMGAAQAWMAADHQRTIDVLSDRLAVTSLLRVADDRALWYLRGHHIAVDGYAALTCIQQVLERYNAALAGRQHADPRRADLAELVADDTAYADSRRRTADREHWSARVADLPERVSLAGTSTIAPLRPVNLLARTTLDAVTHKSLDHYADDCGSSAAVVLTAAFSAYLARMTGADDVVLSLPVTGRATARIKRAGGMVSNMLPIVGRDITRTSMTGLVDQLRVEMTGALRHQRYRFEDIRVDAGMASSTTASFGPIVNMMFFDKPIELSGARVDYQILSSGILEDLRINLYQAGPGERLVVDLHGNPGLYTQSELDRHLRRFLAVTERLLAEPAVPIADIDLLLDGEGEALRDAGTGARRTPPDDDVRLLDGFVRQVRDRPDAVAVEFDGGTWTYADVDALRRELAAALSADGVVVGDRVVVSLPRGVAQVCAVYAILTSGAAYVPVDPQQPPRRRALIADAVSAEVVVDEAYLTRARFDADNPPTPAAPAPARVAGGDEIAYVIFTSGSTGTPKGVEVGHRAILNRLGWMQDEHRIDPDDVVLYKTPITFDVSVWELFWPLMTGARMVIARPDGHRDPDHLADLISTRGVTTLHFVPSMLDTYIDVISRRPATSPEDCGAGSVFGASVRQVFTSGEALHRGLADKVADAADVELINLYGPTEAAVDVTGHRVVGGDGPVPIGRPMPNTDVRVLDRRLRPVPAGVAGELYLAGSQLARGYVGRPDLTADRFMADPAGAAGARMYRTGDLVRWNEQSELEYLGRTDFQVKIRGQRVELGEIEAVLIGLREVDAAVVVARTDEAGNAPRLVAYLRTGPTDVTDRDVRAHCRRHLPAHMIPSSVVVLDDFPVTASGKLDRAALPAPDPGVATTFAEPTSPIEITLAGLVADLIGADRVGLRDNLFAIGADSLTAARLVARARADHGLSLRLADVFDSADLAEMAGRATPVTDVEDARPTPVADRGDVIPLSHAQTRLWFVNRMDPEAPTYNMPGAIRLGPDVDLDSLRQAVLDLITRHESLRTRYPSVAGEPVQQIVDADEVRHLAEIPVAHVGAAPIEQAIADEAARGFDLVDEIGFRWSLLTDGVDTVALLVLHHIAADGFSLQPLIRDLLQSYEARSAGREPAFAPLPIQYADFALWQHRVLGSADDPSEVQVRELDHWRGVLDGMPDLLALPTDRPHPEVASGRGGFVDVTVGADLTRAVRDLAQRTSVTPFTVFHAALAAVLGRLADTDDVPIGAAVAGRDDEITADLVGMFVNTVVLRTPVADDASVTDVLTAAHQTRAQAMDHANIPFERVVDAVAPQRSSAYAPLFQVGLTMQADRTDELSQRHESLGMLDARVPAAKYDLSFTITDRAVGSSDEHYDNEHYDIEISYATDLFDESTAQAIGGYLLTMLDGMVSDPAKPIARIDLLSGETITALTAPPGPVVDAATLRDLFIAGADRADLDSPALVADGAAVTWAMFEARTNQLARELISRGIGGGSIVAISIGRSAQSVCAAVAVAKSGAAFVMIDPGQPAARRARMLADAGPSLGLTVSDEVVPALSGIDWLVVDDETVELRIAGHSGSRVADAELTVAPRLDDLAYLVHTSGSTGRPKAAAVTHRGLATMVANQQQMLGLTPGSRVLHVASPSFDASIFETTMALCTGGRLVISPPDVYGGTELDDLVADAGVTHAVMTPSALATLEPASVPELSTVISVGEPCPPELLRRWTTARRTFFNLYGPTEATIWATAAGPLRVDDAVTIGRAVPGVGALVLDRGLRPVPDGMPGELYLTGVQLGRGYHGRADLTATRFVADPFTSGRRMYRTGDRVVRAADGSLIYNGRTDFQLKIRGQRIEPGEVDAVLMEHPGVGAAVSVGTQTPSGDTVLVSYVTVTDGLAPTSDELVAHVAARLPRHMVPHTVAVVDSFDVTSVGKIDRTALPAVDLTATREFVAPRTEMESVVADVFAQVLDVDRVSVHDAFFDLGGNSLSATKAASRLGAVLDRRVPVKDLFEQPTVAAFAAHITSTMTGRATPPLTARSRAELVRVSGVQRGMWLLNRADPDSANYNVALALRMSGHLDVEALRSAITDIVDRHEALRTRYPMIDGAPTQVILPIEEVVGHLDLEIVDVTGELGDAIADVTGVGFDVVASPPIRFALLRVAADDHVLVFVVHHLSADGASMAPLARDLMTAFSARRGGASPSWEPLPVQYADYALWQHDRLSEPAGGAGDHTDTEEDRQLRYWADRLAGAPAQADLPSDRPRPLTPTFGGAAVGFELPADLVSSLESLARQHNTTLFMVTHAAFAVVLARITGKDDLVIGTPYAGRGDAALDHVVGMFVNTLALRTQVPVADRFSDVLERVRTEDLMDMAHADVAFDQIVARVLPAGPTSYNPLFQVMFAFQNIEFPTVELDGLQIAPEDENLAAAKVDLQLTLFPDDPAGDRGDGRMRGEFLYATDLFDETTVDRIAQWYMRVLTAVAADATSIVGDIALDHPEQTTSTPADRAADGMTAAALPDLVAQAAVVDPASTAVDRDTFVLAFGDLDAMRVAMSGALPDGDPNAALTMALMSGVPDLTAAGADALEDVVRQLRIRAIETIARAEAIGCGTGGSVGRAGPDESLSPTEGADRA